MAMVLLWANLLRDSLSMHSNNSKCLWLLRRLSTLCKHSLTLKLLEATHKHSPTHKLLEDTLKHSRIPKPRAIHKHSHIPRLKATPKPRVSHKANR